MAIRKDVNLNYPLIERRGNYGLGIWKRANTAQVIYYVELSNGFLPLRLAVVARRKMGIDVSCRQWMRAFPVVIWLRQSPLIEFQIWIKRSGGVAEFSRVPIWFWKFVCPLVHTVRSIWYSSLHSQQPSSTFFVPIAWTWAPLRCRIGRWKSIPIRWW